MSLTLIRLCLEASKMLLMLQLTLHPPLFWSIDLHRILICDLLLLLEHTPELFFNSGVNHY